ncbi:alkylated DNA repair protein AlkB homolog 8 isoform X1, partial [Tanacetum coccineum]
VNEYPSGVGLSPHIDTHSAFEGSIYSLSLSGPCIMEFRRPFIFHLDQCFYYLEREDMLANIIFHTIRNILQAFTS